MIRLFTYSLSLRLFAIFLLLAALFAWGVVAGIRWAYSADDLRSLFSGHLSLHVDYVRKDIGSPPRIDRALAITQRVPVDIRIDGPGIHWTSDENFPDSSALEFGPSDYFSSKPGALLDELPGVDFAARDQHNYLRFFEGGSQIMVVTPKLTTIPHRPPLVPILVGFALFLILSAFLAVRWLFRPLVPIRAGAAHIGAGNFSHRISVPREDELGELATDINSMAGKVQGTLEAKQQLLLGVSHELRSPISRMNLGLALLEDSPAVHALREDTEEMRHIVETLLDAEKLGSAHTVLNRSAVQLPALIESMRQRFFANEPRLQVQITGDYSANLDEARVQLMLKNLVGNALRYAPIGPVQVAVNGQNGQVTFRIRDHGPGIAADQRAHLGEPFYRSDASRARDTGGTGLGLYLARQVARAHGGELTLEECGVGALFVVKMPAR